ncbi:MAG TPA: protein kinase [Candidatus Obscuribacterales bacterium]
MVEAGNIDKAKNCPSCKRLLPAGARFCGFDGTPVDVPKDGLKPLGKATTGDGQPAKVCPTCGRGFPPHAAFCPFDAARLIVSPKSPAAESTVQPGVITAPPVEEEPKRSEETSKPPKPGQPTRKPTQMAETFDEEPGLFQNMVGKVIDGKYEIQSVLGEGGMAVVYKAYQTKMERTVVIKLMQGWLLSNKNAVERFEREAKLTAKINHPNIVTVFDCGVLNGKGPYLVMEFIKGESLGDKIARQGALPFATAANIIIQICRGLQEAHSAGIIHRDLKPDNILLQDRTDRPDWVKIVDFGISNLVQGSKRLTKTGKMVGTPEYIAPEQLKDKPIDIRTDLYAVGIILFEILTGRVPFEGESAEAILMKHLLEPPPPLSQVRDDLGDSTPFDDIIQKALKKNPDDRYQTATELRLDVEQALNKVLLKRG